MFAGLLREHIDIYRYTKSTNEYGEQISVASKVYETRAKVSHLSGSRSVINNEIQYPYQKEFVMRINVPILEDDEIRYQNKRWQVLSIDTNIEYQQKIVITELVNE